MMDFLRRRGLHWPELLAAALFLTGTLLLIAVQSHLNGGEFVYALDDPYIHMATAKNAALHGVWGVTRHEFSSAVSSIAWPALIAAIFRISGIHVIVPFLLCEVFAVGVILVIGKIFRRHFTNQKLQFCALAITILVAPLHTLVLSGMEHPLQIFLALLFVEEVTATCDATHRSPARLLLLAALLCAVRYESLFLIAGAFLWLVAKHRFSRAIALAISAAFPLCLYGVYTLSRGSWFLPNPVLLKGLGEDSPSVAAFVRRLGQTLWDNFTMIPMAAGIALLWWQRRSSAPIFLVTVLLILQFVVGRWGHLYRYEACLIVLFFAYILPPYCNDLRAQNRRIGLCLLAAVLLLPFAKRIATSQIRTFYAPINIHDQQIQMGRFLAKFYTDASVAVNDIGAVNYLADIRCLDVWGLSDFEVASAQIHRTLTDESLAAIIARRQVVIAVCYQGVLGNSAPFMDCGTWTISHNYVCARDTVHFYARDAAEAEKLRAALNAFAPQLPAGVTARINPAL